MKKEQAIQTLQPVIEKIGHGMTFEIISDILWKMGQSDKSMRDASIALTMAVDRMRR